MQINIDDNTYTAVRSARFQDCGGCAGEFNSSTCGKLYMQNLNTHYSCRTGVYVWLKNTESKDASNH